MNEAVCEICGTRFIKNSNNHKYCGDECARIAEREKTYQRVFKYRHQWGMANKTNLGTGNLGSERNKNFKEEYDLIQKEKRGCGLI